MRVPPGLDELGRLIAAVQDASLDREASHEAMRQHLAEQAARRDAPARRRILTLARQLGPAVALLIVVLGVVVGVSRVETEAPLLTFTVGEPPAQGKLGDLLSAQREQSLAIAFSEGTKVFMRPGARGRVMSVGSRGADLILESGRARFEIAPHPQGAWSVRTGPFTVRVKGTKFEAEYDTRTDRFLLELHEGRVVVSGCGFGDGRSVEAGESLSVSCAPTGVRRSGERAAATTSGSAVSEGRAAPAPAHGSVAARGASARSAMLPPPARSWVELARAGRYDDAYELARDAFDAECRHRDRAELWLLGDVARLTGHAAQARRAYIAVRDRFPGTPASADAAFAIGRLALQADGDRFAAERWFEVYLQESPAGPLAQAALGRVMEVRLDLGDGPGAVAVARQYLDRYPTGPLAAQARRLLGSHLESPNTQRPR